MSNQGALLDYYVSFSINDYEILLKELNQQIERKQHRATVLNTINKIGRLRDDIQVNKNLDMILSSLGEENCQKNNLLSLRNLPDLELKFCSFLEKKLKQLIPRNDFRKYFDQNILANKLKYNYKFCTERRIIEEYQNIKANINRLTSNEEFNSDNDYSRRKAFNIKWNSYNLYKNELSKIFSEIVKIRGINALDLGYRNYYEFSIDFRLRNKEYLSRKYELRNSVKQILVPLYQKIHSKVSMLRCVKNNSSYNDSYLMSGTKVSFSISELSDYSDDENLSNFLNDMKHNNRLLVTQGLSFTTYIGSKRQPIIAVPKIRCLADLIINFHEIGHAYQIDHCQKHIFSELRFPFNPELCETPAFLMEHYVLRSLYENGKLTDINYITYILQALYLVIYSIAIDKFEETLYCDNIILYKNQCEIWKSIEKEFFPTKNQENEYLNEGSFWAQQSSIISSPLYYYGYGLAQLISLQAISKQNKLSSSYYKLSQKGFNELLEITDNADFFNEKNCSTFCERISKQFSLCQ